MIQMTNVEQVSRLPRSRREGRQGVAFPARTRTATREPPAPTGRAGGVVEGGRCSCGPVPLAWLDTSSMMTITSRSTRPSPRCSAGGGLCTRQPTASVPPPALSSWSCSSVVRRRDQRIDRREPGHQHHGGADHHGAATADRQGTRLAQGDPEGGWEDREGHGGVDHQRHTRNDAYVCEHAAKLPS
jgi:hypothetical protein